MKIKIIENVKKINIKGLKPLSTFLLTITGDNGSKFAYHEDIAEALEADFYVAYPYFSWERGLNENTNGLVQQSSKEGSYFSDIDDDMLTMIENNPNDCPRKALN